MTNLETPKKVYFLAHSWAKKIRAKNAYFCSPGRIFSKFPAENRLSIYIYRKRGWERKREREREREKDRERERERDRERPKKAEIERERQNPARFRPENQPTTPHPPSAMYCTWLHSLIYPKLGLVILDPTLSSSRFRICTGLSRLLLLLLFIGYHLWLVVNLLSWHSYDCLFSFHCSLWLFLLCLVVLEHEHNYYYNYYDYVQLLSILWFSYD